MNKLPIPRLIIKVKAEIEFIIKREIIIRTIIIREETLITKEVLIILEGNKGYNNKEYKLSKLVSINISIIRNEIISNIEFFYKYYLLLKLR